MIRTVIHATDLAYRHAGGPLIEFADVRVGQGGVLVLRGPSGAGKSTWLALAAGMLQPTRGELLVAGQSTARMSQPQADAWRARNLGFLPQRLHLSAALTVGQNLELAFFAAGLRVDAARITAVLAALGLSELSRRKPSQISGGQALRVALARCLLLSPQVILADEPTASLDDAAASAALELLQQTASRQGATLVVATHDARVGQVLPEARIVEITRKNVIFPSPEKDK